MKIIVYVKTRNRISTIVHDLFADSETETMNEAIRIAESTGWVMEYTSERGDLFVMRKII